MRGKQDERSRKLDGQNENADRVTVWHQIHVVGFCSVEELMQ
jgi:hypothetical protein